MAWTAPEYIVFVLIGAWFFVACAFALYRQYRGSRNSLEIRAVVVEKMDFPVWRPATKVLRGTMPGGLALDQLIDQEFQCVQEAVKVTRALSANAGLIAAPIARVTKRSLEQEIVAAVEQVVTLVTDDTVPGLHRLVTAIPEYIAWWVFPSDLVRIAISKDDSDDWIAKIRYRPRSRSGRAQTETEKVEDLFELPARVAESVAALYDRMHPLGSSLLTHNEQVRQKLFDFIREVKQSNDRGHDSLLPLVAKCLSDIRSRGLSPRERCMVSFSLLMLLPELRRGRENESFCVTELMNLEQDVETLLDEAETSGKRAAAKELGRIAVTIHTNIAQSRAQLVHRYYHEPVENQAGAIHHARRARVLFDKYVAPAIDVERMRLHVHALRMLPFALHCRDDETVDYDEVDRLYDLIIQEYESKIPGLLYPVYNNSAWQQITRSITLLRRDREGTLEEASVYLDRAQERLMAAHREQGGRLGELHRSNLGLVHLLKGHFAPEGTGEPDDPDEPTSAAGWARSAIMTKPGYLEAQFELWLALSCAGDEDAPDTLRGAIEQVQREATEQVLISDNVEDRIVRRLALHLKRSCCLAVAAGVLAERDVLEYEILAKTPAGSGESFSSALYRLGDLIARSCSAGVG